MIVYLLVISMISMVTIDQKYLTMTDMVHVNVYLLNCLWRFCFAVYTLYYYVIDGYLLYSIV